MWSLLLAASLLFPGATCLKDVLPLGEKDLLEPQERWPDMRIVPDSTRQELLKHIGYADSNGTVPSAVKVFELSRCPYPYGGSTGVELLIFLVRGQEGDRDDNVWMVTWSENQVVARTLIGQLQTTCTSTFLRGCSELEDGSLQVQQLQHNFECGTDVFNGTEHLPGYVIYFRGDGTFEEVLPRSPAPDVNDE
jgi:hypothetical protein